MGRTPFDGLHLLRLAGESGKGRVEVCRGPEGTDWVRLHVSDPGCQRELLAGLKEGVPARWEGGGVEILLPWREGISLRQWLYEYEPDLGRRRDACLSLLEGQIEGRWPPCLTALAARPENLVVEGTAMALQCLPALGEWEPGMGEAQAVGAVAAVIWEVLTAAPDRRFSRRMPEEVQLLERRQREGDYAHWGQLQRDVAAIPDEPPRGRPLWRTWVRRAREWFCHWEKYILAAAAGALLAAALVSLASAYGRWRREQEPDWQGMPQVGDQDLRREEGGE